MYSYKACTWWLIIDEEYLSPAVSEVNDENQLDEDEEKASNHAEVHPHLAECPVRDPEGANHSPDDEQVFEAPEPVLDPGSAIVNQNAGITVMKLYVAEIRFLVHHYIL